MIGLFKKRTPDEDLEVIKNAKESLYKDLKEEDGFWDPSGNVPKLSSVKEENLKNHTRYLDLKKNPNSLKRKVWIISGIFFGIALAMILALWGQPQLYLYAVFPAFIGKIILIGYTKKYKNFAKDIIKLEIAQDNNYLYWPTKDRIRWKRYEKLYPEIFRKGTDSQNVEDVFWGKDKNSFICGLFHYTVTTHNSKGQSSKKTYTKQFFIIKLPKKIESRFFLYPKSMMSRLSNLFTKKNINTESIAFNKKFSFSYKGKRQEKQLEIAQVLTPRVQEELLKLEKHKKNVCVLFTNNEVVFCSDNAILTKLKTNLIKKPMIHEQDKKKIHDEIGKMIQISDEIVKYLD